MKRSTLTLLAVLLVSLLAVTPVLAEQGHIYGVVFVDSNLNGVWDVGEQGMPDVVVTFESADGDTSIDLDSAPVPDEIDPDVANVCSYLDPDAPTPCQGTFGLYPAGDTAYWWKVMAAVPAGYYATSENPQWVQVQGEDSTMVVQFGVAKGAYGGGQVMIPATGAGYELYAAGTMLIAGVGLMLKRRRS